MPEKTRTPRDAQLLATLAESLEPRRPPFYVSGSMNGHPDGWYWVPATSASPQYLGRNVIFAEKRLLALLTNEQPATR